MVCIAFKTEFIMPPLTVGGRGRVFSICSSIVHSLAPVLRDIMSLYLVEGYLCAILTKCHSTKRHSNENGRIWEQGAKLGMGENGE